MKIDIARFARKVFKMRLFRLIFKHCEFILSILLSSQWRRKPIEFLNQTEDWKNCCRNRSTYTNNKSSYFRPQNIDPEPGERSNRVSKRFQFELWWDYQTWRKKRQQIIKNQKIFYGFLRENVMVISTEISLKNYFFSTFLVKLAN